MYIHILTSIAIISIITDDFENIMSSGDMILPNDDFKSSKPTSKITIETHIALKYSILPCPNGWSLSAGLPESLKPKWVITDEPASERLLNASAIIPIEDVNIPAKSFITKRHTFKNMPTNPPNIPYFLRTFLSAVFL